MFDENFIDRLPDEPLLAASELCKRFLDLHEEEQSKKTKSMDPQGKSPLVAALAGLTPNVVLHDKYLEALAVFQALAEAHQLKFSYPALTTNKTSNIELIVGFFRGTSQTLTKSVAELTIARIKLRYATKFGKAFLYEFSQGDLDKIQQLVNELRDKITKCDQLENNHKQRLLRRLERLQGELHKKVSDLDRFWGLIGDAGVVLGKLGRDAKPIVDRIREIAEIVWRTQSRAEELPSDAPPPLISHEKFPEK